MSLTASEGGTKFPVMDAGVYQAVCYAIYDLGHQYSPQFEKSSHKALIVWEIPSERIDITKDGVAMNLPRVASMQFTMSLNDKANLKKFLESWRGRAFTPEELVGFDISKLVGANCMLQIIHRSKDGKTYANVSAVLPLYKGMKKLEAENPIVVYKLEDGEPPEGTPKWIVDVIHNSSEWKEQHGQEEQTPVSEELEGERFSDVPF
jgi:hypothetical protein